MFQQNYFDGPTKLFSDLYPAKFYLLDPSSKIVLFVYKFDKKLQISHFDCFSNSSDNAQLGPMGQLRTRV